MKIVHIANFYGSNSGGIKTTIHELGRGYQRYGHQFIYIVPGPKFMQEETPFGTRISLPSRSLPFTGGYQMIKSNKQLLTLLKFIKPDRIEVSDRFSLIKVGKWAKRMKIPTLVFSHETLAGLVKRFAPFIPNKIRSLFVNHQNKKLAASFDYVVVTTDFAAKEFEEIGIENLRKISLGVDLVGFNPSSRNYRLKRELIQQSEFLMIYCGRLSPEKEPLRVLDTLKNLLDMGIKVRLVVLGGGPLWKKFRAKAKELPVEMVGYVASREKVANYLSCADIAIAPGPLETFCLSALEALASGVPVIASASSAVGEILNSEGADKAGLVAKNNGESFALAAKEILENNAYQRNARKRAEQFAWSNTISQMLELHQAKRPMVTVRRRLKVA